MLQPFCTACAAQAKANGALGDTAEAAGDELVRLLRAKAPIVAVRQCIDHAPRGALSAYRGRNEYTVLHLASDERRHDVVKLLLATNARDRVAHKRGRHCQVSPRESFESH